LEARGETYSSNPIFQIEGHEILIQAFVFSLAKRKIANTLFHVLNTKRKCSYTRTNLVRTSGYVRNEVAKVEVQMTDGNV
jgi:hypothetical protein